MAAALIYDRKWWGIKEFREAAGVCEMHLRDDGIERRETCFAHHLYEYVNHTPSRSRAALGSTAVFLMNGPEKRCA